MSTNNFAASKIKNLVIMLESKKIGNKIAEARKRINISQAQLAERLFISSQAVGKWERGESMPDIITFDRLSEILGVDLNYFSAGKISEPTSEKQEIKKVNELVPGKKTSKLNWDMSLGNWVDADFSGLKNLHEKFDSSNMRLCKFNDSNLSGLLLKTNNVDSCDFSGSDLSNSRIQNSNLQNNIFRNCLLSEIEFSGTYIDSCDFYDSKLHGTKFTKSFIYGCNLSGVDFTNVMIKTGGFTGVEKSKHPNSNTIINAVWNHTSFIDTQIADLVFTGTLDDCYFENCKFTRVIFRDATLINTFFKNNKNLKRVQFIDCKTDRMTYEFLKQGMADLSGITLLTTKGGDE
jgi:uncharacterized protein YjbI with pentapeptide repeats